MPDDPKRVEERSARRPFPYPAQKRSKIARGVSLSSNDKG